MKYATYAEFVSAEFTEVFVEQLVVAICAIPSHHTGGVDADRLISVLLPRIGGGRASIRSAIACLMTMRLITEIDGVVGRSTSGDVARRQIRSQGSLSIAIAVMRAGLMADQVRALRSVLSRADDVYICSRKAGQYSAPQLIGLLSRFPDVEVLGQIRIGRDASLELDSVWNELPLGGRINWSNIENQRKAIADRAELYSLQIERSAYVGAWERIRWVSRDDDSLGYDIEVPGDSIRRIEVKGSRGRDAQFFLSSNEYRVACRYGKSYEIHFWGEMDLSRYPPEEYQILVKRGYPVRVADPARTLAHVPWKIEPSQYRVTRVIGP